MTDYCPSTNWTISSFWFIGYAGAGISYGANVNSNYILKIDSQFNISDSNKKYYYQFDIKCPGINSGNTITIFSNVFNVVVSTAPTGTGLCQSITSTIPNLLFY